MLCLWHLLLQQICFKAISADACLSRAAQVIYCRDWLCLRHKYVLFCSCSEIDDAHGITISSLDDAGQRLNSCPAPMSSERDDMNVFPWMFLVSRAVCMRYELAVQASSGHSFCLVSICQLALRGLILTRPQRILAECMHFVNRVRKYMRAAVQQDQTE